MRRHRKFDRLVINNRWRTPKYTRDRNWLILGIGVRYWTILEYEYYISFFGVEFRFWFNKEIKLN